MAITGNKVVLNLTGQDNMKHVEADDFVIHLRSFQGGIEHSRIAGKVSNAYTVLTPLAGIEPRFYRWVLKSAGYIQELNASTNQLRDGQSIKFADFAAIDLPLPPVEEQRRIADFLDDQVARIDGLVKDRALQESAALDWQRAVTDLLLTDVETERPLKAFTTKIGSGKTPRGGADVYLDGGVLFLRSQNVHDSGLSLTDVVYIDAATDAEMTNTRVHPGDVLLNITGGSLGRCCAVPDQMPDANVSQHVCIVRPKLDVNPQLLAAALRSPSVRSQIEAQQVGGNREGLNFEQVGALRVRVPHGNGLEQALQRLHVIEAAASEAIRALAESRSILEERKRAVITAAVTGELDVTTARPIGVGKWVPNVGASVDSATAAQAQAPSIGGIG